MSSLTFEPQLRLQNVSYLAERRKTECCYEFRYQILRKQTPVQKRTPCLAICSSQSDSTEPVISTNSALGGDAQMQSRRVFGLFGMAFGIQCFTLTTNERANAFLIAPPGFRAYSDKLNGFYFFYPDSWVAVKGAGSEAFFRETQRLDENLSINASSPSSSRYKSIRDLGSPEKAGKKILSQYLTEFMSTRLGVQRVSELLSAEVVVKDDGKEYYYIQANVKSYANTNELAIMPDERILKLEWDRRYLIAASVENSRLYQLRLQLPEKYTQEDLPKFQKILESFHVVQT